MKIATEVLVVLDAAETDGNALRLVGQLDRKLYEATNKVLVAAGGKWNRSAKAHLFCGDAADAMEQIILTGEVTTHAEVGYFPTPPAVVARLIELARLEPGMVVLEPSAGRGAIAKAVSALGCDVVCVELLPENVEILKASGYAVTVACADFLTTHPRGYDRVVMNPPFAKQADIEHVTHALKALKPGGLLVSVMSNGVMFRENAKTVAFRALVEEHGGEFHELPEGAFKASGTGVRTVIVVVPS